MDFSNFEAITFDCYGTLVDWEAGILGALRPWCERFGLDVADEDLLAAYGSCESAVQAADHRPYREVLEQVMQRLEKRFRVPADATAHGILVRSLPRWPPFPDSAAALRQLSMRFRLGIVSNIDDDLFAATQRQLGVEFDWVVTAEQVGSYKPAAANFEAMLERSGLPRHKILHAAQSRFHDIAPASALGLSTVWVNRRSGREGSGATPPAAASADLELDSMQALADLAAR